MNAAPVSVVVLATRTPVTKLGPLMQPKEVRRPNSSRGESPVGLGKAIRGGLWVGRKGKVEKGSRVSIQKKECF